MKRRCLGCMKEYDKQYEVCPYCGYVYGNPALEAYHLPPGTILQERYLVGTTLGFGGFGVTYIGWDKLLEKEVAIKEYLPGEFATRMPEQERVTIFSGDREEQFVSGLDKFVDEAKRLAKFQDVEGIVHIFDSFSENRTAYIVMEYLEGETLKTKLDREGKISVEEATDIMLPVLHALKKVHKEGIIHRDIAPDNIYITKKGKVKLLDFGAARFATTKHSKSLSVILKPGYSPEEQYRSRGDQGPWTDVYSVAATFYKMITGIAPQDSMERNANDKVKRPSKLGVKIKKSTENSVLNAMNILIEGRTPSADKFIEDLEKDRVKRVKVKIKRFDVGHWPKWVKVTGGTAITAVLLFIALLLSGVIHFNISDWGRASIPEGMTRIPSMINLSLNKAVSQADDKKLIMQVLDKNYSKTVPQNRIISQTAIGGSVVEVGYTLGVIISAGPEMACVPDILNFNLQRAATKLAEHGIVYSVEEEESDCAPGSIISQSVQAGEKVVVGSEIILSVSTGKNFDEEINQKVPDLKGMTFEKAKEYLLEFNLYAVISETVSDEKIPYGEVVTQFPDAGMDLFQNGTVALTINREKEDVIVPDLQYETQEEAIEILKKLGLNPIFKQMDDNLVANNCVAKQEIEAGALVAPGTDILVYISGGNILADNSLTVDDAVIDAEAEMNVSTVDLDSAVEGIEDLVKNDRHKTEEETLNGEDENITISVPTLVGISQSDAESRLQALGLVPSVSKTYSDKVVKGSVISQGTISGTKVKNGTSVVMLVSLGVEQMNVPNVVGLSQTSACSAITASGLNYNITSEYSDTAAVNSVITQGSLAGSQIDKGSVVNLVVSLGIEKVIVPNIIGQGKNTATGNSAWDKLPLSISYKFNSSYADGYVCSQSIAGGKQVDKGTGISIVISKGPAAPTGWNTDGSFSSSYYTRNERMEYRYQTRTRTEKTATTSSLSGWTYLRELTPVYGAISEYTTTPITETANLKVYIKDESETTQTGTTYYYYYYLNNKSYIFSYSYDYAEESDLSGSVSKKTATSTTEFSYVTTYVDPNTGIRHKNYSGQGKSYWFLEKTEPIMNTNIYSVYASQSITHQYLFEQYSEYGTWVSWSTTPMDASDTINVEARTTYSYTLK